MPQRSDASWTPSITSAACRSALVGMQPQLRQVPPQRSSFSTTATLRPSPAARSAAEYPAPRPGGARRAEVPAGAAPEDDEVVGGVRHGRRLLLAEGSRAESSERRT